MLKEKQNEKYPNLGYCVKLLYYYFYEKKYLFKRAVVSSGVSEKYQERIWVNSSRFSASSRETSIFCK